MARKTIDYLREFAAALAELARTANRAVEARAELDKAEAREVERAVVAARDDEAVN